jgi:predicted metal-dependent hydrolase
MKSQQFDPFASRRARDIRNGLSKVLIQSLEIHDPEHFRQAGKELEASSLDRAHRSYVRDRLRRYEKAFSEVQANGFSDSFRQALILWDRRLFFEAHERLETAWQEASGDKRRAIKGLIKAAGVYVHREQGHEKAARTLAGKALALLQEHGLALSPALDLRELLDRLKRRDPVPPLLLNQGQRDGGE